MFRINNIKIRKDISNNEIFEITIKKNRIDKSDVINWNISKKSIDARNKEDVHYIYCIDLELKNKEKYANKQKYKKLEEIKENKLLKLEIDRNINKRIINTPLIIGAGPAGLFSALTLIQNGLKPIIIEQGNSVEQREKTINEFLTTGKLNEFSNVQFGEGGAGTFSDGKLTTGINSQYCKKVLQEFVNFGAPEEILYLSKPHIGTNNLVKIIKNMRIYIEKMGGQFLFNTKVVDFNIVNNTISSVITTSTINKSPNSINKTSEIFANSIILAIGHSSRDTFKKLHKKGFSIESKNFSVGVRIEHSQKLINTSQYGTITKLKLPPAEYKLSYHSSDIHTTCNNNHSCYTFCMCPGGVVMPSSSEKNTIVTNGMSNYLRDGQNANSALLVNITPDDLEDSSPLGGMYFQEKLEKDAFILGGSNYYAPIQRIEDFLNNKKSTSLGSVIPTYKPGTTLSNLNEILPEFISNTLKEGILNFDKKLKGFANPDSILTGLETRSSSPIRILRDTNLQSNIKGVYPCGEGAGYAGGIMSVAVDGIKCALSFLNEYK